MAPCPDSGACALESAAAAVARGLGRLGCVLPYWLVRVLGRADGPRLVRCGRCRAFVARGSAVSAPTASGLFCSVEHAEESELDSHW